MHDFDLIAVGTGGGPFETNLSAYLVKSAQKDWEDGVVALEAGSGMGALTRILQEDPKLFHDLRERDEPSCCAWIASHIYSCITTFLITHAHLDHIASLVLTAGSLGGKRKDIAATRPVLKALETIFSDKIWPNLASWDDSAPEQIHRYVALDPTSIYHTVGPNLSARVMLVSHGSHSGPSSTFFVRNDTSDREFLFFGDVEPDTVAEHPKTRHVWCAAAPKVPHRLSSIFLECSWPSGRPEDKLFGHLSPEHVLRELQVLATEVVAVRRSVESKPATPAEEDTPSLLKKRKVHNKGGPRTEGIFTQKELKGVLTGVKLYVIHCKEGLANSKTTEPASHTIERQIRQLVDAEELGVEVIRVDQGMRISIGP